MVYWLRPQMDVTTFRSASPRQRARWIAENSSVNSRTVPSFVKIFRVSVDAMIYRLLELDLVR
jgi:hypothetical protein